VPGEHGREPGLSTGIRELQFPVRGQPSVAGLVLTFAILALIRAAARRSNESNRTEEPPLPSQKLLRLLGWMTVAAILGFLLLPALVVTLAAFNSRAILSFPPETWSWRWFVKALAYEDFQAGFRNGLIVTAWASSIALVVGAAFALALERYEFRFKRALEACCSLPSWFRTSPSASVF